jgi:hypothetical protein
MTQIWEIIPKITSPLAVICFGFYVFYLYKRNEDRKKEKSLLVNDKIAQRNAADKILNDYPDLKIDTIKDPAGAIELARKMIDDKLKKYHKTLNALLIFSAIFAITFLLSLLISNKSLAIGATNDTQNKNKKDSSMNVSWSEIEATKNSYPYATLSIVQHIKLRDIMQPDSTKKRVAEFRNYYTISAIRNINSSEHLFEEQFLTNTASIKAWPGSEIQEVESISDGRYWVKFDLKKSETKTIVTGANYVYSVPLVNSTATSCFGNILSSNSQWMTCYPNSVDYIDNLTIIIESDGIDISLPPIATYKKATEGNIIQGEGSCKVFSNNNNCTLLAKWEKIAPGECVGFKINWSLP